MSDPPEILMGFYGDDFTGSTDAMEALTRAGLRTILFLTPPDRELLRRFEGLGAIGVAGCTRALPRSAMATELRAVFTSLRELQLPIVHYKVCSTFDSSPEIGSIGQAIDIGAEVFGAATVPLLAGVPILGRYCVFGNLFARSGSDTDPYRLDRHPTMSRHPITPMTESDIRLHLAKQTTRRIELLDVLALNDPERACSVYRRLAEQGAQVVVIDLLLPEQELVVGQILNECRVVGRTAFLVGSSGIEYALTRYWRTCKRLPEAPRFAAGAVGHVMIVSGSCSPVTERQIAWAVRQGAIEIPLDTCELLEAGRAGTQIAVAVARAVEHLKEGRSVICHSARGPSDPRVLETIKKFARMGREAREQSASVLGDALGAIALAILRSGQAPRVVVTGGDTSYFTAKRMGIAALEMIAPIVPGCPLCRAYGSDSPVNGIEICFKGGQVGGEDFFGTVLDPCRLPR